MVGFGLDIPVNDVIKIYGSLFGGRVVERTETQREFRLSDLIFVGEFLFVFADFPLYFLVVSFGRFDEKIVDVNFFQVFGCLAFVLLHELLVPVRIVIDVPHFHLVNES